MLALMPMERVVMNVTWMNKACSENEHGICPWPNGRFFFRNTIPGTLIGRRFKPIRPASIAMFSQHLPPDGGVDEHCYRCGPDWLETSPNQCTRDGVPEEKPTIRPWANAVFVF